MCATSSRGQCARFVKETSEQYDIEVPAMTRKAWDVIGICCDSETKLGFCEDIYGGTSENHARCPPGQVAKEICASDGSHGNHKCKDTYGSFKFHHTVSCCPIM